MIIADSQNSIKYYERELSRLKIDDVEKCIDILSFNSVKFDFKYVLIEFEIPYLICEYRFSYTPTNSGYEFLSIDKMLAICTKLKTKSLLENYNDNKQAN